MAALSNPSNAWELAGWTMLWYLGIGAGIGVAGWGVRFMTRRFGAPVRYVIALATLVLLSVTPVAIAIRLNVQPQSTTLAPIPVIESGSVAEEITGRLSDPPPGRSSATENSKGDRVRQAHTPTVDRIASVLPAIWLAGSPLLTLLMLTGIAGANRMRRRAHVLVDGPVVAALDRLCENMACSRRIVVAVCDRITTPVLVGIVRPAILLPPAAVTGWNTETVEMVLLHELAHIRRHDNLVNVCQRIVETLLFFQPAVWIASRWVRLEREHCCDEFVVRTTGRRDRYAQTLVRLASERVTQPPQVMTTTTSMADSMLRRRIRNILLKEDTMHASPKSVLLAIAAVCLVSISFAFAVPADERGNEISVPETDDRFATNEPSDSPAAGTNSALSSPGSVRQIPSGSDVSRVPDSDATRPNRTSNAPRVDVSGNSAEVGAGAGVSDEGHPKRHSLQQCVVNASEFLVLSEVDGILQRVEPLVAGAPVQRGQVLAQLHDDEQTTALAIAKRRADQDADVRFAETSLKIAAHEYEQKVKANEVLKKRANRTQLPYPESELEGIRLKIDLAKIQVERAMNEREVRALEVRQAEATLARLRIRSPIDGFISAVKRRSGEAVRAGDRLFTIVDLDRPRVRGYVDAVAARHIKPGMRASVAVKAAGQAVPEKYRTLSGQIRSVGISVDPVTQAVVVEAEIENKDLFLRPGMVVEMTIEVVPADE